MRTKQSEHNWSVCPLTTTHEEITNTFATEIYGCTNDTLIHKREANVVLWSVEKRRSVRNSEQRGSNWISMPETKELASEMLTSRMNAEDYTRKAI